MDEITILAGGWSAREVDLTNLPGTVIGVNDAAIHARCDIAVSMDRLWTENRWAQLEKRNSAAWIRSAALKNIQSAPTWLRAFECDYKSTKFSEDFNILNGFHSGYCALNLAYQIAPERIYLVGFDMKRGPHGEAYWYPDYPWAKAGGGTSNTRYGEWAMQMCDAALQFRLDGIDVLHVTASPSIGFPTIRPKEFQRVAA